jgi:hypothetical protein
MAYVECFGDDLRQHYEYITLLESTRRNAERHRLNAAMHFARGNMAHAAGSMVKCLRNLETARLLSRSIFADIL